MRVIKPQKLGLLTRCFEFKRRYRMGVSVLMHVPLSDAEELYTEVSMWKFAGEQLGKDTVLDAGIPKLHPEFLVHGKVFAPGGEAVKACAARARFGSCEKTLFAFGDRHWNGNVASAPEPFTEMPLDWTRAYGGDDYPANPLGKGRKPIAFPDGSQRIPLPNIEHPQQRIVSPREQPAPVAFGTIDQTWPQRAAGVGTYDDAWLKNEFPGFAGDIDWTFFNVASRDQWLTFPVPTNEAYEFENLHPRRPVIAGHLPGFSARVFIGRGSDEAPELEKVATRLSTVWFFPAAERAILIYQGFVDLAEEDGADIRHMLIAAERSSEPKSPDHYLHVLTSRLDPERGALNSLKEHELLPPGLTATDPDVEQAAALLAGPGRLRRNNAKRGAREIAKARADVASHGLDPDAHGPAVLPPEEPLPPLEHLPEFLERKLAEGKQQQAAAKAALEKSVDQTEAQFLAKGMDFAYVREEISRKVKGPPEFSAKAELASLAALARQHPDSAAVQAELDQFYRNPEFIRKLEDAEQKMRENYVKMADRQDPADPMPEARRKVVHAGAVAALERGQSFAGLDLTGGDFSGLDLSGANFAGAFLECANFRNARLVGCDFTGAVLARAQLQGADLTSAVLKSANIGRIECDGTRFDGADCSNAILRDAHLSRASFRGAQLVGADCMGARFEETDWGQAKLTDVMFIETSLTGLKLSGANLSGAGFLRCDVTGVDFRGAVLDGALFLGAKGKGADFSGASLHNLRCVENCDFTGADFSDTRLTEANLRCTQLEGAHFLRSRLDKADLSESKLRGAWFYLASAIEARFIKADLRDAVLVSCNLMNASLQRSDIIGADFRLANLFQADFARVRVDRSAQFDRALRTRLKTVPRLVEPAS